MIRIAVIGAGHVGATFAFALLRSGLAAEIVLVDVDVPRLEGEVMDLLHAVPFGAPVRVWAGSLGDCAGAAVTVVAAGSGQRPGQTRLDLARRNAEVVRAVVPEVARVSPGTLLLVASNPVDVLTRLALDLSGFPPGRVLGSGTLLDTARFRALLAADLRLDPRNVHAWILGEHGDSEVPAWSLANVAGVPFRTWCASEGIPCEPAWMDAVFQRTRAAAAEIIRRKGATWYAIGAAMVRVVEAVVRDERAVLTVSSRVPADYLELGEVCLSLPSVVGAGGVERVMRVPLVEDEADALRRSGAVLEQAWRTLSVPPR